MLIRVCCDSSIGIQEIGDVLILVVDLVAGNFDIFLPVFACCREFFTDGHGIAIVPRPAREEFVRISRDESSRTRGFSIDS